jgi:hypothetical protein
MDTCMAAPILRLETREERIIYYTILWTWGFWGTRSKLRGETSIRRDMRHGVRL